MLEAEARLLQLGRQTPDGLIQIYRAQNNSRDLFGNETWPRDDGVVAFHIFDSLPIFGVNSDAPPYKSEDRISADSWRSALVQMRSDVMQTENLGWKPNNALYHAETTVLLRTARANGGRLVGRELTVYVDSSVCSDCRRVLPLLTEQLGVSSVTFMNTRTGAMMVIRDGKIR